MRAATPVPARASDQLTALAPCHPNTICQHTPKTRSLRHESTTGRSAGSCRTRPQSSRLPKSSAVVQLKLIYRLFRFFFCKEIRIVRRHLRYKAVDLSLELLPPQDVCAVLLLSFLKPDLLVEFIDFCSCIHRCTRQVVVSAFCKVNF